MRTNTSFYKLGALLFLAISTIHASRWQSTVAKNSAGNTAPHLARVQVVDQVEPLCRALFPDQKMLHFRVAPLPLYHNGRHRDNLWTVDCLDKDSEVIAQLLWNPDTRRALQFAPTPFYVSRHQKPNPLQSMDEQQVIALARAWTARLRPASSEDLHKNRYQIQRKPNCWYVRLSLPDGLILLWINAHSGELQSAILQDMPHPDVSGVDTAKRR